LLPYNDNYESVRIRYVFITQSNCKYLKLIKKEGPIEMGPVLRLLA